MRKNLLPAVITLLWFWWLTLTYLYFVSGDYSVIPETFVEEQVFYGPDNQLIVDENGEVVVRLVTKATEDLGFIDKAFIAFGFWKSTVLSTFYYLVLTVAAFLISMIYAFASVSVDRSGRTFKLRSSKHRTMNVNIGNFLRDEPIPPVLPIQPGFVELMPHSVARWLTELKEPYRALAIDLCGILNAHRRYPAHWSRSGHGRKSLLKHTGNVIHYILQMQKTWVYPGTSDRAFTDDDPIPGIAALAHDFGKIECYKQKEDGTWEEIYRDHDNRSSRILSRMDSFWKLPDAEREQLLTVIAYYHRETYMPKRGPYHTALIKLLNAADSKAATYESVTSSRGTGELSDVKHRELEGLSFPHDQLDPQIVVTPTTAGETATTVSEPAAGVITPEAQKVSNDTRSAPVEDKSATVRGQTDSTNATGPILAVTDFTAIAKAIEQVTGSKTEVGDAEQFSERETDIKLEPWAGIFDEIFKLTLSAVNSSKAFNGMFKPNMNDRNFGICRTLRAYDQDLLMVNLIGLKTKVRDMAAESIDLPTKKDSSNRGGEILDLIILRVLDDAGLLFCGQNDDYSYFNSLFEVDFVDGKTQLPSTDKQPYIFLKVDNNHLPKTLMGKGAVSLKSMNNVFGIRVNKNSNKYKDDRRNRRERLRLEREAQLDQAQKSNDSASLEVKSSGGHELVTDPFEKIDSGNGQSDTIVPKMIEKDADEVGSKDLTEINKNESNQLESGEKQGGNVKYGVENPLNNDIQSGSEKVKLEKHDVHNVESTESSQSTPKESMKTEIISGNADNAVATTENDGVYTDKQSKLLQTIKGYDSRPTAEIPVEIVKSMESYLLKSMRDPDSDLRIVFRGEPTEMWVGGTTSFYLDFEKSLSSKKKPFAFEYKDLLQTSKLQMDTGIFTHIKQVNGNNHTWKVCFISMKTIEHARSI